MNSPGTERQKQVKQRTQKQNTQTHTHSLCLVNTCVRQMLAYSLAPVETSCFDRGARVRKNSARSPLVMYSKTIHGITFSAEEGERERERERITFLSMSRSVRCDNTS